jgi:hypothetical protein
VVDRDSWSLLDHLADLFLWILQMPVRYLFLGEFVLVLQDRFNKYDHKHSLAFPTLCSYPHSSRRLKVLK